MTGPGLEGGIGSERGPIGREGTRGCGYSGYGSGGRYCHVGRAGSARGRGRGRAGGSRQTAREARESLIGIRSKRGHTRVVSGATEAYLSPPPCFSVPRPGDKPCPIPPPRPDPSSSSPLRHELRSRARVPSRFPLSVPPHRRPGRPRQHRVLTGYASDVTRLSRPLTSSPQGRAPPLRPRALH